MSRRYFGTDGIRGRVGEGPISADFVLRLGNAYGHALVAAARAEQEWRKPMVVIGKDTRISNYMFEAALEAGLVAAGVDVQLMGPMPTPAVAHLTHSMRADGGIVISASHNPHHDNGIKFFSAQGEKLDDATELAIEAALDAPFRTVASERLGKAVRTRDTIGRYVEACKNSVPRGFNLGGMRVVVDCANGATYQLGPLVLRELGARVDAIGVEPNGVNINDGVGSTHPESLAARVRETGADLGIAFDGDGDRVLFVDARGEVHDGDALEGLLAAVAAPIAAVCADKAYDSFDCHAAILAREARPVIPPRKGAAIRPPPRRKDVSPTRGAAVARIAEVGRDAWKAETGYHRRSLAETAMLRYKTLIGPSLRSRSFDRQKVEASVAVRCINRFTALGMPKSIRIA